MIVALLGGAGFLGSQLAAELINAGQQVRILTRKRESAKHLISLPLLEVRETNAFDSASLAQALAGCDAVVHLIGLLHGSQSQFLHTHVDSTETLIKACQLAGVLRYVHVSALGAEAQSKSDYQMSKAKAEAIVQGSPLAWTIIAPSVVFGAQDSFTNLFANIARCVPAPLPFFLAGSKSKLQPVAVDDVAHAITKSLINNETLFNRYELGGPEVFSLGELFSLVSSHVGRRITVFNLPQALALTQAWLMEKLPGPTLISRDNLRSLASDNVTHTSWPSYIGRAPKSLRDALPTYLGEAAQADAYSQARSVRLSG